MSDKNYSELLQKARNFCSRSEKCPEDVRMLLSKYNDSKDEIVKIIAELQKDGFIDIERYVRAYVNDKIRFDKWGRIKISFALRQKNLPDDVVSRILNEIDKDEYLNNLRILIKNKTEQIKETDPYKLKHSVTRFCVSRGFEYDYISKILENRE